MGGRENPIYATSPGTCRNSCAAAARSSGTCVTHHDEVFDAACYTYFRGYGRALTLTRGNEQLQAPAGMQDADELTTPAPWNTSHGFWRWIQIVLVLHPAPPPYPH